MNLPVDKDEEKAEKEIRKIYRAAGKIIEKQVKDYFAPYKEEDEKKRKAVENGELEKSEYIAWREQKMAQGKKFKQFCNELAETLTEADQQATELMTEQDRPAYEDGMKFALYQCDRKICKHIDKEIADGTLEAED